MMASTLNNTTTIFTFDAAGKAIKRLFPQTTADCHIQITNSAGNCHEIAVHTRLLSALSSVFRAMFSGNWQETNNVKINDASFDTFTAFLQYFYQSRIQLSEQNVGEMLYLASKYDIADVVVICGTFLRQHLTLNNAIETFSLAVKFELDVLKKRCKETISANAEQIITSKSFVECDWRILYELLNLETMSCTETDIFDACILWAIEQCKVDNIDTDDQNLRVALGSAFGLIQFERMPQCEFIERFKHHRDMFTKKEIGDIVCAWANVGRKSLFQRRYRKKFRFYFTPSVVKKSGANPFKLGFRSSQLLKLKSFGLSNSYVASMNRDKQDFFTGAISVRILNDKDLPETKRYNFKRAFQRSTCGKSCLNLLENAIVIQPNYTYEFEVHAVLKRPDVLYTFTTNRQQIDEITLTPFNGSSVVNSIESVISELCFEHCDGGGLEKSLAL